MYKNAYTHSISICTYACVYTYLCTLQRASFAQWESTHNFPWSQRKTAGLWKIINPLFFFNAPTYNYRRALTALKGFVQVCLTAPHSPRFKWHLWNNQSSKSHLFIIISTRMITTCSAWWNTHGNFTQLRGDNVSFMTLAVYHSHCVLGSQPQRTQSTEAKCIDKGLAISRVEKGR